LVLETLSKTQWHIEEKDGAAVILGLNPNTLRARMHKLGLFQAEDKEPDKLSGIPQRSPQFMEVPPNIEA